MAHSLIRCTTTSDPQLFAHTLRLAGASITFQPSMTLRYKSRDKELHNRQDSGHERYIAPYPWRGKCKAHSLRRQDAEHDSQLEQYASGSFHCRRGKFS